MCNRIHTAVRRCGAFLRLWHPEHLFPVAGQLLLLLFIRKIYTCSRWMFAHAYMYRVWIYPKTSLSRLARWLFRAEMISGSDFHNFCGRTQYTNHHSFSSVLFWITSVRLMFTRLRVRTRVMRIGFCWENTNPASGRTQIHKPAHNMDWTTHTRIFRLWQTIERRCACIRVCYLSECWRKMFVFSGCSVNSQQQGRSNVCTERESY